MFEDRHKTKDELKAERQNLILLVIAFTITIGLVILEYFHMNPIIK